MSIERFKIVNDDGSTNKSEYERCIQFLNDYIEGKVKVYQKLDWDNPYEVDMTRELPANVLLKEVLQQEENRLLSESTYKNIKNLIHGMINRIGSTIHTCGTYIEDSIEFTDGPGYRYDVLSKEGKDRVYKYDLDDRISVYYLLDDYHSVLEYNDKLYFNNVDEGKSPSCNFPEVEQFTRIINSNVDTYPDVYKGNLSGVYSDFQRLAGQYVGSSTLFYYSKCNDIMYTTGPDSYVDPRTNNIVNFNFYATCYKDTAIPTQGVDLAKIATAQASVVNPYVVNAALNPELTNDYIPYHNPYYFTSADETIWVI